MGCGASRDGLTGIETPINHVMKTVGISSIDDVFTPLSPIIKELENIRVSLIDGQDELLELTGAAVYKEPSLAKIILCILQKISCDCGGDIKKSGISIVLEKPYFTIGDKKHRDDFADILKQITEYIEGLISLEESIKNITERITELAGTIPERTSGMIDEVKSSASSDPLGVVKKISTITKNSNKASIAVKRAAEISVFAAQQLVQLKDFVTIFNDETRIASINDIGKKSHERKLKDSAIISWEYASPTERIGTHGKNAIAILKNKKHLKSKIKTEINREEYGHH
jgi:hypothetical protein